MSELNRKRKIFFYFKIQSYDDCVSSFNCNIVGQYISTLPKFLIRFYSKFNGFSGNSRILGNWNWSYISFISIGKFANFNYKSYKPWSIFATQMSLQKNFFWFNQKGRTYLAWVNTSLLLQKIIQNWLRDDVSVNLVLFACAINHAFNKNYLNAFMGE